MADDRKKEVQYYIRWISGLMASAVLVYLSVLSIQESFTLETPVIVGLLSLIVILMYGADALEGIIDSWRRG